MFQFAFGIRSGMYEGGDEQMIFYPYTHICKLILSSMQKLKIFMHFTHDLHYSIGPNPVIVYSVKFA